jgi:ubiquinone/menaquinone biosynthesis C-methylase UbiE
MSEPETDPNVQRAEAREGWERIAATWRRMQDRLHAVAMPVSQWLIEAIEPQPGQRILELAAGTGDTGFLAAELVRPAGGTVICSDGAEAMLEQARARAAELGVDNVEFRHIELEWIDLPTASVDAVLCRWGYMFAVDRDAAFRETRRVLKPGGRVALATWATIDQNPWAGVRVAAIEAEGHPPPPPPGPFELGTEAQLRTLLEDAGFDDVATAAIDVAFAQQSLTDYWETTLAMSRHFAQLLESLDEERRAALRRRVEELAAPYAQADGTLRMTGRALVAAASA